MNHCPFTVKQWSAIKCPFQPCQLLSRVLHVDVRLKPGVGTSPSESQNYYRKSEQAPARWTRNCTARQNESCTVRKICTKRTESCDQHTPRPLKCLMPSVTHQTTRNIYGARCEAENAGCLPGQGHKQFHATCSHAAIETKNNTHTCVHASFVHLSIKQISVKFVCLNLICHIVLPMVASTVLSVPRN